jgi:hypothetical protein
MSGLNIVADQFRHLHDVMFSIRGEKVLERLATSDKCTIVVQKQPDGKMRVTSGSWEARRCF